MDELRFVRREELALVVANEAGEEFRLLVDEAVLSELRHLSRRDRTDSRSIRPREIQALIRAGKTRAQVAKQTGLDEADIERYEEPVLAERRYILERAQSVAVRADAHDDDEQSFGGVIGARLVSLGAEASEWSSWKEDEEGWMIGLEFLSHETAHRAVWSFDHRKNLLAPLNPDAVNLSKQGEVGDRLIPKLRAVDNGEQRGRFDSDAFDRLSVDGTGEVPAAAPAAPADAPRAEARPAAEPTETATDNPDAEYERRREIDQRAVKTDGALPSDLSQTADLLDALRRRRGERERATGDAANPKPSAPTPPVRDDTPIVLPPAPEAPQADPSPGPDGQAKPRSIWAAGGVSREAQASSNAQSAERRPVPAPPQTARPEAPETDDANAKKKDSKGEPAKRGRASIPSWDDILFGTRSDEDPA